jgi:hypothetical protein
MTWAVGGTHVGCCRCIADIQATLSFQDGRVMYFDVVQKVHEICPNIMIAFAGDIEIGLKIIKKIKIEYISKEDPRHYANPILVALSLFKYIKYAYEKILNTKKGRSPIELLICISPNDISTNILKEFVNNNSNFFKNEMMNSVISSKHIEYFKKHMKNSDLFFENIHKCTNKFITFKTSSPKFDIKGIPCPMMGQIGSGSEIESLNSIVSKHEVLGFQVDNGPESLPDLVIPTGSTMSRFMASLAKEVSVQGISKTMHMGLLSPRGCTIKSFKEPNTIFPETVDNWDDFKIIMKEKNISLATCQTKA